MRGWNELFNLVVFIDEKKWEFRGCAARRASKLPFWKENQTPKSESRRHRRSLFHFSFADSRTQVHPRIPVQLTCTMSQIATPIISIRWLWT